MPFEVFSDIPARNKLYFLCCNRFGQAACEKEQEKNSRKNAVSSCRCGRLGGYASDHEHYSPQNQAQAVHDRSAADYFCTVRGRLADSYDVKMKLPPLAKITKI